MFASFSKSSKRPNSELIERFQGLCGLSFFHREADRKSAYDNTFSGRENGPALSPRYVPYSDADMCLQAHMVGSVFGRTGEMEIGDHASFDDYSVPGSINLFSGHRLPSQSLGQVYEPGMNYSANDVDRAISPKNMFGAGNLQSAHGWLPSSQPNWNIDSGSFDHSIPSQQQKHADLFANNYACEPSQIFHCDSGYETRDEPANPLSQNGFSRRQSSEGIVMPSPQNLSLKSTKMSHTENER